MTSTLNEEMEEIKNPNLEVQSSTDTSLEIKKSVRNSSIEGIPFKAHHPWQRPPSPPPPPPPFPGFGMKEKHKPLSYRKTRGYDLDVNSDDDDDDDERSAPFDMVRPMHLADTNRPKGFGMKEKHKPLSYRNTRGYDLDVNSDDDDDDEGSAPFDMVRPMHLEDTNRPKESRTKRWSPHKAPSYHRYGLSPYKGPYQEYGWSPYSPTYKAPPYLKYGRSPYGGHRDYDLDNDEDRYFRRIMKEMETEHLSPSKKVTFGEDEKGLLYQKDNISPRIEEKKELAEEEEEEVMSEKENDQKTIYKREISINWPGLRDYHCIESIEENELDLDRGNQVVCRACTLPIFSTPCDNEDAGGPFLHKCCVQLPKKLKDHSLHFKRPLFLHEQELPDSDRPTCDYCHRKCEGFFYQCSDYDCRFTLDVLCTKTIKIVHRSHQHELVHIHGTDATASMFVCGACGSKHDKGDFYWCNFCDFYLHQDCAVLPNFILHNKHQDIDGQPHPLCLTFLVPDKSLKFRKSNKCSVCLKELLSIKSGMYFCTRCEYAAHVKCATSDATTFHSVSSHEAVSGLIHLPMPDENTSLLQHLLQGRSGSSINGTAGTQEKMHGHELINHNFGDEQLSQISSSCLCDACVRPISSPPFYSCDQCNNFYLHSHCANLPLKYQHVTHEHGKHQPSSSKNLPHLWGKFSSSFICWACIRLQNGFIYRCKKCSFAMDVECALLPEAVTHEAHGKSHILFLSDNRQDKSPNICHCCNQFIFNLSYECCSCPNFKLDVRCALLPLTVSHRLDRHPLKLSFFSFSNPQDDVDFCEICEKGIGATSWFYHCEECTTLFHIDCIPCVGAFSKIKFGFSFKTKGHSCPLTCIRLLESYSYTCDICGKAIEGKEEGIAYGCIKCWFWVHDYCCAKMEGDYKE